MNTLEFLQRVLPDSGVYFLALAKEGMRGMAHYSFNTLEGLATAATKADNTPGVSVYFACGTYLKPFLEQEKNGKIKKVYRVTPNGRAAKAFWLDVDCGEAKAQENKGYATKQEAAYAVRDFCAEVNLPLPLMVSSGGGLHCYWTLDAEIDTATWRQTAAVFKGAVAHFGLLADPSRTADFSSVLRPVGTHHRKDENNPLPVKLAREGGQISFLEFDGAVRRYADAKSINTPPAFDFPGDRPEGAMESDLAGYGYPDVPHSADKMADGCAQVRFVRDTGGDDYEQWRGVIGLLKFCDDGLATAHSWSSQSESYDSNEVDQKIHTWNTPPSTCSFFERVNAAGCEGCPHRGKITTPVQLGRDTPVQEEHVEEVINEDTGETQQITVPAMPPGYWFDEKTGFMFRTIKDAKTDVNVNIPFANMQFYPVTRVSTPDGVMSVLIRAHKRDKKIKEFVMPTEIVGAGAKEVKKFVSKYEVTVSDHPQAGVHMEAYIRNAINKLMEEAKEIRTLTAYGWTENHDGFLLGEQLIRADGESETVLVSGQAPALLSSFKRNTVDTEPWVENVDWLYNRPGMEPFQYAICAAFGSILSPFMEDTYHGIPVALTGKESGKGKSTACKVAIYGWGDANKMMVNGDGGSTPMARYAVLGTYQNIPMLFDEFSKAKADFVSDMLYTMSNGRDKVRLKSTNQGVQISEANEWFSSNLITSNTRIGALLATDKGNTQAEAVRVFEIYLDKDYADQIPALDGEEVKRRVLAISKAPGAVGRAFAEAVVKNLDAVQAKMGGVDTKIVKACTLSQEHRFYRQHAVCTMTAALFLQKMGFIRFDLENLFAWVVTHISKMSRDVVDMNVLDAETAFVRMLADLQPRIISTDLYSGKNMMPVEVRLPGPAAGRFIRGNGHMAEPLTNHLYVAKNEMQRWATQNRYDLEDILRWAASEGAVLRSGDPRGRFNLTKGTSLAALQPVCVGFDMTKLEMVTPGDLRVVRTDEAIEQVQTGSAG